MIQHSRDFRRIKRICDYPINADHNVYYLLETVNGKDMGCWLFNPFLDGYAIHATLSEECRGRAAVGSAREAIEWIFDHTSTATIYAAIPPEKRNVCALAVVVGFQFTGIETFEGNPYRVYRLERIAEMERAS